MTIAVDDVCTRENLEQEVGGPEAMRTICTNDDVIEKAREDMLGRVLQHLANRVPPVLDSDIAIPAELKFPVLYGALARLYRQALTTGDDVNAVKAAAYERMYQGDLSALRPTVIGVVGNQTAAPMSVTTHRR